MKLYHVCPTWNGSDLESLYRQHKDEAYEMYADKWPEAGELAQYHTHYIHLHSTLDDAQEYADEYGGEILVIEALDDELDVETDTLEYNHPVIRDVIPAEYIKRLEA